MPQKEIVVNGDGYPANKARGYEWGRLRDDDTPARRRTRRDVNPPAKHRRYRQATAARRSAREPGTLIRFQRRHEDSGWEWEVRSRSGSLWFRTDRRFPGLSRYVDDCQGRYWTAMREFEHIALPDDHYRAVAAVIDHFRYIDGRT